jgi:hypothetical protein
MVILLTLGCLVAILCLWILPVVLGVKAAKRNNRSPHWMWFGIHPLGGWIAFLVLQFAPPQKCCSQCGEKVKAHAKICPYCMTPFGELQPPPALQAKEQKQKWIWIGSIAGAGVLGIAGFVLFTMSLVVSSFKDSGAYQQALQQAQADPRVVELLGLPITGGSAVSGSISTRGDASGEADLSIPISGPKANARLYLSGKLHAGIWTFQTLEVDPKNGKARINLLNPATDRDAQ